MSYRDELDAVREQNADLRRDLAEAHAKIRALEDRARGRDEAPRALARSPEPSLARPRRLGRVHFHRPPTWVPLLHLWLASARAAAARVPRLDRFDSDSVIGWLVHHLLLVPSTYGLRVPLYVVSMCIAVSVALLVSLLLTPLAALAVLGLHLRFSDEPVVHDDWLEGRPTLEQGAMYLWALECVCMWPLLLTTTSLIGEAGGQVSEESGDAGD